MPCLLIQYHRHICVSFITIIPIISRQLEHRAELYKQAGTADDLLAGANSLKGRRRKRDCRLNNTEKKLLLPAKNDSTDEEDCDDTSATEENMSINEEADSPDGPEDLDKAGSPSSDAQSRNKPEEEVVYTMDDTTAPSASHNHTHECTGKVDNSENEVSLAKDGHNLNQEIGKVLEQQIHTCNYISVNRLPDIQVSDYRVCVILTF